jgi:hypothetical protein
MQKFRPPVSTRVSEKRLIVKAVLRSLKALFFNSFFLGQAPRHHQLPACHHAMTKVRKQVPALVALVDFWWQGVWQDVEPCVLSPRWRQWVQESLLPLVYGEQQVARTRCARRKAKLSELAKVI